MRRTKLNTKLNRMIRRFGLSAALLIAAPLMTYAGVDQITLGPANENVTFIGENTTVQVVLGDCTGGTCTLDGNLAFGSGTLTSGPAPWSITTSDTNVISLTEGPSGLWFLSATAPIFFSYGTGGALLTGNINLVSVQQTPNTNLATFDHNSNTLTNLGGSLASAFGPAGGIIDWTVAFGGSTDLRNLLGAQNVGMTYSSSFSSGEIVPTPEPGTLGLILIGSSLIGLGGFLRRRRSTQSDLEAVRSTSAQLSTHRA